jgi:phosphoglycolate/pyridoxal phosphate phosphatase family enzyme
LSELSSVIKKITSFIIDMDGVLYLGDSPLEGAAKAINRLREMGKKLTFSTNNSTLSRKMYVRKLAGMGINSRESEIVTSAYATAVYFKEKHPNAKIYAVGEEGLKEELRLAGFKLLSDRESGSATHVVVGLDRKINYRKLTAALRALLSGAELVATNPDDRYPTENGLAPGAGAMIGALTRSSGKKVRVVIGKPSPYMVRLSLKLMGSTADQTAIVGDRLDTDVRVGNRLGLTTILVLTGVASEDDLKRVRGTDMEPDFVIRSLMDLVVGHG